MCQLMLWGLAWWAACQGARPPLRTVSCGACSKLITALKAPVLKHSRPSHHHYAA